MYFFIYRTTNIKNGKFYIGKHKTLDLNDGYIGSGTLLKRAISKYGLENFISEKILFLEDEETLNAAEKSLVIEDLVNDPNCYNITLGGQGGFSHIINAGKHLHGWKEETRIKSSKSHTGYKHSEETKQKMSESKKKPKTELARLSTKKMLLKNKGYSHYEVLYKDGSKEVFYSVEDIHISTGLMKRTIRSLIKSGKKLRNNSKTSERCKEIIINKI